MPNRTLKPRFSCGDDHAGQDGVEPHPGECHPLPETQVQHPCGKDMKQDKPNQGLSKEAQPLISTTYREQEEGKQKIESLLDHQAPIKRQERHLQRVVSTTFRSPDSHCPHRRKSKCHNLQ